MRSNAIIATVWGTYEEIAIGTPLSERVLVKDKTVTDRLEAQDQIGDRLTFKGRGTHLNVENITDKHLTAKTATIMKIIQEADEAIVTWYRIPRKG